MIQENTVIRVAAAEDAEQLIALNESFNGQGEITLDSVHASLSQNKQEMVIVAEVNAELVGFVCVQLKKSFCYADYMPEITEVYVKPDFRKRGIATKMIAYAETCCTARFPLHKFELLTGQNNRTAQAVYQKLGYTDDREVHMIKRITAE